jgi:hypothetical protein
MEIVGAVLNKIEELLAAKTETITKMENMENQGHINKEAHERFMLLNEMLAQVSCRKNERFMRHFGTL